MYVWPPLWILFVHASGPSYAGHFNNALSPQYSFRKSKTSCQYHISSMFKSTLLLIKSSINPAARKSRRQKPVLTITLSTPFFQCGCVREVPAIRSTAGLPASSSPRWTDADDVAPFRRAAQLPWKLRSDGVAVLHCHWLERGGAPAVGPRWVWLQMREEAEL